MSPITLPVVTVQHDMLDVVSDVDSGLVAYEDIWVSCYKTDEPSVHGKVRLSLDDKDRSLVRLDAREGVEMTRAVEGGAIRYAVACPQLTLPTTDVVFPSKTYKDPQRSDPAKPHAITAFDVSPDGKQIATGYHDGNVHILPTSMKEPSALHLQRSKPHLSSVISIQFFPSSKVLLTAGSDFTLCVLPAEPLSPDLQASPPLINPARTLRAHTRPITATAILERGRNVLSAAKDGTVRLWDVGAGAQIRSIAATGLTPITAMAGGGRGESTVHLPGSTPTGAPAELPEGMVEAGTKETLAICALNDGSFEVFGVSAGSSVFRSPTRGSALTSIAYSEKDNMVATGSSKGIIGIWDTRSLNEPVVEFTRGTSTIEGLTIVDVSAAGGTHTGVVVTTTDALPFVASVRPEGPQVAAELIGSDCDRVGHIRVQGSGAWGGGAGTLRVWTAADDGIVRCY